MQENKADLKHCEGFNETELLNETIWRDSKYLFKY